MRVLKYSVLILILLTLTVEGQAQSLGRFYSLDKVTEFIISYDPEADVGLGSNLRLNVEARLKNGKLKPFTKWSKVSVDVQGGELIRLRGNDVLRVASDMEQIEDHKVRISITLKDDPEIQGSATIALNYRGTTHIDFDARAGANGTRGNNGARWGQWHGGDGFDGQPGADGKPAEDVVVYVRREPELVDGHQLVRVTARTFETEREYLFNADGGRLQVSANGGRGGAGGNGGKGGPGNNGKMNGNTYRPPGRGGNGGNGANGGNGGRGGNITVFVHPDSQSLHEAGSIEFAAAGGAAGAKGAAGKGGSGGGGNNPNGSNRAGQKGRKGSPGQSGQAGSAGTVSVNIQETPDWTSLERDPMPFAAEQVWKGQYICGQGRTDLELQITGVNGEQVAAVFDFTVSDEIAGSFHILGEYDPTSGQIVFTPGEWISQPTGYVGVGLTGQVDRNSAKIRGQIDSPSCSTFAVSKQ